MSAKTCPEDPILAATGGPIDRGEAMGSRRERGWWIAAALACACAKPTTSPTAAPPAREAKAPAAAPWEPVRSPAGAFAVEMPPGVEASRRAIAEDEGKAASYTYRSVEGETMYVVFVTVYAGARRLDDREAVLDVAQQRAMSNVGGTVFSTRSADVAGHPGRAAVLHLTSKNIALEANVRLVLLDDRVYELVVLAQRDKTPAAGADRFFASFQPLASEPNAFTGGDEIQTLIQSEIDEVRRCYAYASAAADRELAGRIAMHFTIGPEGTVTACRAGETSLPEEMTGCMVEVIQALKFPRPSDGKPIAVQYPFVFDG
ncbi:AgmX/PglI C-terminal domain-containing protein [Nannocystis punicea]|uniref:AgmX/PglI C-terminal domain-containing protein n=1 Tax=Nannocystis punicea TaxID=2995304 RepID=A0ABY7HK92_9BACT|nr:AgmX/PglI C-terminal domain-containing protein [Nannocystis poenicansa]WAS99279.1 AgmX/PglI C-terminal domain-containing protein [Nannocystis poenicansa]